MNDDLGQRFESFFRGACQPDEFERQLLALCRGAPDRAWQVLALLDQFYRRRRIPEDLCRRLRHHIGRQAMRLEGHTVEPEPPAAPAFTPAQPPTPVEQPPIPVPAQTQAQVAEALAEAEAADAKVEEILTAPPSPMPEHRLRFAPSADNTSERSQRSRTRWRRGFQTSPVLGLIVVMLGVAASTTVQDVPGESDANDVAAPVATAPAAPEPEANRGPGVVSLSSDRYLVYPHQRTLEFTVERSTDGGDAGFVWWTQPAGAKSSQDYIGTRARRAAMPGGTASIKLQVPILANPQRRHIQIFYVLIGKANGGADLGTIRRATVFILPADSR